MNQAQFNALVIFLLTFIVVPILLLGLKYMQSNIDSINPLIGIVIVIFFIGLGYGHMIALISFVLIPLAKGEIIAFPKD